MTTNDLRAYLAITRHILDLPCVSDADKLKTVDGLVDILIADLDWSAERQRDQGHQASLQEEVPSP